MFVDYIRTSDILFKHAKGMRDITGKEFHTFHEIFLLIGDTANFTSDYLIDQISPQSLVLIPKEQFHQFDPVGEEKDYHRYVLQFDSVDGLDETVAEVMNHVKIIQDLHPETLALFDKLSASNVNHISENDQLILLRAVFAEILIDLKYNYDNAEITNHNANHTVSEIISYIDKHYLEQISIKSISQNLNFSETFISHKFKESMHISVYNYILKKKLTHAYSLIKSGIPATDAARLCGFLEYSGFYKMYKKYFGISPSKTRKSPDKCIDLETL